MNPLITRLAIGGQKGLAPAIILITLAIVFVVGAIAYGVWITVSQKELAKVVQTTEIPRQIIQPGNPDCPDTDYTGCDTSSDFMTWTDDGERNTRSEVTK